MSFLKKEVLQTQRWITSMVIDLNLCPFAERVFRAGKIRYTVSEATGSYDLLADVERELKYLTEIPRSEVETSLLIHPYVMQEFLDYNDFVSEAESLLETLGFEGTIQIAGFHPLYQFASTEKDAVENYTNRSPYPMLHLLREESITEIAAKPEELLQIPQRNIEKLRDLGLAKVVQMREACFQLS